MLLGIAASSCTGTTAADVRRVPTETTPSVAPTTTSSTTSTTTTTTSPTTTVPPETTTTTEPPWQPPPIPEVVLGPDGQPLPKPPVVLPDASWVSTGIPAPGSMFENLRADDSLDPNGKWVALTFDDGPGPYTSQIVDLLKATGTPATFFMLGSQIERRADLVRSMVADGFRVGVHSRTHKNLREALPWTQIDEIAGAHDQVESVVGPGVVKCFRPPYGAYDQYALDLIESRGLATAMWSLDTLDWQKPDWTVIVNRVMDNARNGTIILMHDGGGDRTATVQALGWIILGLRARGFTFVPIC